MNPGYKMHLFVITICMTAVVSTVLKYMGLSKQCVDGRFISFDE